MTASAQPQRLEPGAPYPLGATWDGLGVNFAVFSANASRIELCLFDPHGRKELARLDLPECTDEIWHGYLPGAQPGVVYGFRAHGPYQPQHGHRFNPTKLLLDPYAKQLVGPLRWTDALFGYRMHSARGDLSLDRRDSAPAMPKAVVVDDAFDWSRDVRPDVPWTELMIYETHVKGATIGMENLLPPERGTFAALGSPRFIEHLTKLGITAIELMPIHAFMQDRFLVARGLANYWGYSTLSYFAPEPAYMASGALHELKIAIRQLHAAGIEVVLDVVYNHTCEGDAFGPTLSWRGLDNASYYRLVPGDERHYINDTGCGNTLNLSHPRVLQMVMDSLRYWATHYNVDGFRFDLGATLGREGTGFDPGSGFFDAIGQDPVLSQVKLIAEPWDIGPGGYQLGNHPPGFAEWNDRFRDCIRRFWRGDEGQRAELAARITGSADLFQRRHRRPWTSVNFAASHDGFTLADTTRYIEKHNEANGEDNRDGHSENYTSNWGAEGDTDDASIRAVRERVARSMLTSVFTSLGTPMIVAGDEFGRSQQGNNNAYCQDNPISWLDWTLADSPAGRQLTAYVARLVRLRKNYPVLRQTQFLVEGREALPGIDEVGWFDDKGMPLSTDAWHDPNARVLALRRAGPGIDGTIDVVLLLMNASAATVAFTPPPPRMEWNMLADSASPELKSASVRAARIEVQAHSMVVLLALGPEHRGEGPEVRHRAHRAHGDAAHAQASDTPEHRDGEPHDAAAPAPPDAGAGDDDDDGAARSAFED